MRLNICLIEDKNKWKFRLVQNALKKDVADQAQQYDKTNRSAEAGIEGTNLQAYNMLDMNVAGAVVRGVSMMYATTVGRDDATASVMIAPDADHVKISI